MILEIGYVHGTRRSNYIKDGFLYNYKPIFELPLNACNGRILQLSHFLRMMAGSGPDELIVENMCK